MNLLQVELQPLLLHRQDKKVAPRRFVDDHQPSAFSSLDGIGKVSGLRWREVRDQKHADQVFAEAGGL
jgi:hypothetical protein